MAKGFELLGNKDDQIQQRLGGIYALEGVLNTSEEYHQPVLEALCSFVRDKTRNVTGDGPPATDIQAALTVIGRRKAMGEGKPNLADAHIPQPNLADAHIPQAELNGAYLVGAYLVAAYLVGVGLFGADLSGATLSGADLSEAFLISARLVGAYLNGANLSGAYLLGADLSGAVLIYANLDRARLDGAKGLTQKQLDQACGENVKLDPPLTIKPCKK